MLKSFLIELPIVENTPLDYLKVSASTLGLAQVKRNTSETGSLVPKSDKESAKVQTVNATKETSKMGNSMDGGHLNGKLENLTKANGNLAKSTAKASNAMQTEMNMSAAMIKEILMTLASTHTQTATNTFATSTPGAEWLRKNRAL